MNSPLAPRFALTLAALVLVAGCSRSQEAEQPRSAGTFSDDPAAHVDGAIVVDFKDGTTPEQFDAWEREWGVDLEFNSAEGVKTGITLAVGVEDEESVLARIRQHPAVESAEQLVRYEASYTPNDPDYGQQWNLTQIGMPTAWEKSRGKGVIVAVLDTGIAYEDYQEFKQVPDLKGARFATGYDFVNDDEHANDDHGHGTHVAGTIAQVTNNKTGVAGVAFEATLMPVKVLNHFGSGTSSDIAEAIRFAADKGAQVINLSLGGGGFSKTMADAVEYARKKGAVVVCAAGNSGAGRVEYPAAYPGSVAVAAVGPDGTKAPYSSWGKELDIAAPGGDKRKGEQFGVLQNTIDPRDPSKSVYAYYQGTSMATPHVSGVAALLFAAGARSPEDVEKGLYAGASRVAGQDWSDQYGHGVLNAQKSLEVVGSGMGGVNWNPLFLAAGLLAFVLLTLGPRNRPGYFNIFFKPGFLIALVLSTVGFFLGRIINGEGAINQALDTVAFPLPDLDRIIFGRGKLANPVFYSALVPILAAFLGMKWKSFRPVIAGLAIGFAGFLGYAAFAHAPALAWMPFTFLALPWLLLNTVICLFVARAMLRKGAPA
ncbi:MAG: S8 family serine peptidase [Myxococcota bacterium]|nr:S8 family serine peptidase [Myxococcota bacterium]